MTVKQIILIGLITMAIVATVFGPIIQDQQESLNGEMIRECNAEYGPGEWVAVPANGSERGLFLGQMAVCVSEESPRADRCDVAWIYGCDPPLNATDYTE